MQNNAPAPASKAPVAMLRVACDGDTVGAEVTLNGQFKGECPFDTPLAEGSWTLRALKRDGVERERVYETEFRIASGTVKRLDIELGAAKLTAEGERLKQEREVQERRVAQEKAANVVKEKAAREAKLAHEQQARAQEVARLATTSPEQLLVKAQGGDFDAMAALGESYLTGRGQEPQAAQALRWFKSAAQAGNAHGMAGVGYMTLFGIGVPSDQASGKSLLRRAADEGNASGMYGYGLVLAEGLAGQTADLPAALVYFKRAADAGNGDAGAMLAYFALKGKYAGMTAEQAWVQLQALANQGSVGAAGQMWWCYSSDISPCIGVAKDDALAIKWMGITADRGGPWAMSKYGSEINSGIHGPRQEVLAVSYWRRAAEFGLAEAMYKMGLSHFFGIGGQPKDRQQYLYWMGRAAAAGDDRGRAELARPRM